MNAEIIYAGKNERYNINATTQKIKHLLLTPKGTIALERDYGISIDLLDQPSKAACAMLTAEIITEAAEYISEISILQVTADADDNGKVNIKVEWKYVDD